MTIKNFIGTFTKGLCNVYVMDSGEDAFFWDCFSYWDGEWCTPGYEAILDKAIVRSYISPGTKALCLEVLR